MHKFANLGDTVCFWFGANTTAGGGGDGGSPAADVRLAGAAADAAPVLSPAPSLLSHANYPAGCYEVAVAATQGNGFAAGNEYAVFCTLAIDGQNPTGFVGSFRLDRPDVNVAEVSDSSGAADALEANVANLNAQVSSRSSHAAADVWAVEGRTLSSFGSLAADVASAVWGAGSRTLSNFGTLVSDMVTAVFAKTGITVGGAATFASIVRALYAYARGKVVKTSNAYAYKDDDDDTTVFTNTAGTNERTPS